MVVGNVIGGNTLTKKTKGRKKIEIKKIQETNSRQVTFSKRRIGVFKKASELCILTGAQAAVLVNSPGGRMYAFGHHNVDAIVDRYLGCDNKNTAGADLPPVPTEEFNQYYGDVSKELEAEKMKSEMTPVSGGVWWCDEPIHDLNVEELEPYLFSLGVLKKKVFTRADELMMINKAPALLGSNSNVFEMGRWNNNIQTMDIPTYTTVYGGSNIQHGGEVWKF